MDQQLDQDRDLVSRLEQLELPPGSIDLDDLGGSDEITGSNPRDYHHSSPDGGNASCQPDPAHPTFNEVLSASRVYNRVQSREIDAVSTILTARSRAWSILSGISLAQVSVIAVVKLPLYEPELKRFWSLASSGEILVLGTTPASTSNDAGSRPFPPAEPTNSNERTPQPTHTYPFKRLKKELDMLNREPHEYCAAGPIDEDMVCCLLLLVATTIYYPNT